MKTYRGIRKCLKWLLTFTLMVSAVVPSKGVSAESNNTSSEVTAAVKKLSGDQNWSEYNFSVTNGTSSPISGVKISVPFTGNVDNLKSWGCNVSKSGSYIIINYTSVLEAGQTYSCIGDETKKFGFGGGATLGLPTVEFVYGTEGGSTSTSELKYALTGQKKTVAAADTPVGKHGKLKLATVNGYSAPIIVDKNGVPFQLRGASSHGIQWDVGYNYVNKGSYQSLRDEWGVNMVRLAAYVTQNGYTAGSKDSMDTVIQRGVQAATELGMYVIVDWHIHAENPHTTKEAAKEFFTKYAIMYKDYDNVIFEICNEPTGVDWYNNSGADLYSYCREIATVIRECGSSALIVCGTNTWSQDVDDVAKKPLKDDGFENILYTFHFYSGSHYEDKMNKVKKAIQDGTPLFATEFGICDASGNGNYDTANADEWIKLFDENSVSYCCWSLCNKDESASYLKSSCSKTEGGWIEEDLSTTGIWLVNTYRAHQDAEETGKQPPAGETEEPSQQIPAGETEEPSQQIPGEGAVEKINNETYQSVKATNMQLSADLNGVTDVEISDTYQLAVKKTMSIKVAFSPKEAVEESITISTSAPEVVEVNGNTIKGLKAGTAKITVVSANGITNTFNVKVMNVPVKKLRIKATKKTVKVGKKLKLKAVIKNKKAGKKVCWKSSNEKIATVNRNGIVKAVKKGKVKITAIALDGSGKKASLVIKVKK